MPITRKQRALLDAVDAPEASTAPGNSTKPTKPYKRKGSERSSVPPSEPSLAYNAPATEQKPVAKTTKKTSTTAQKKVSSNAPETTKGDKAEGPSKSNPPATFSENLSHAGVVMAGVNAGEAKMVEITKSGMKYYPAPSSGKRPRNWPEEPPKAFLDRAYRAQTEKMFIVNHTLGHVGNVPVVTFDIVGTTGNLYKTHIEKVPSPGKRAEGTRGTLISDVFSPSRMLMTTQDTIIRYPYMSLIHLAMLQELSRMLVASPLHNDELVSSEKVVQARKPVEGPCPVCSMDFNSIEEVTWCRVRCGNNIHKLCFERWATTNKASGLAVRCAYCRIPWRFTDPGPNLERLREGGFHGKNGYVNVGDIFGIGDSNVGFNSSTSANNPPSPNA
ncbi:hypothetical protein PENANT_c010G00365 [Penicillium antarcticum]|uniref:RING-type domain-containing protein n=1 Tax=Penicillium antarcticum TaxID=416450 RepID=A0A1V6Q961_9EURO|nr:hypothetical protein PENANT_c010G00365 [Penicillium antarcticum]